MATYDFKLTYVNKHGSECWTVNDNLHREDGPAATYSDGSEEWYLNGVEQDAK